MKARSPGFTLYLRSPINPGLTRPVDLQKEATKHLISLQNQCLAVPELGSWRSRSTGLKPGDVHVHLWNAIVHRIGGHEVLPQGHGARGGGPWAFVAMPGAPAS